VLLPLETFSIERILTIFLSSSHPIRFSMLGTTPTTRFFFFWILFSIHWLLFFFFWLDFGEYGA
jgi:hypothetical protein